MHASNFPVSYQNLCYYYVNQLLRLSEQDVLSKHIRCLSLLTNYLTWTLQPDNCWNAHLFSQICFFFYLYTTLRILEPPKLAIYTPDIQGFWPGPSWFLGNPKLPPSLGLGVLSKFASLKSPQGYMQGLTDCRHVRLLWLYCDGEAGFRSTSPSQRATFVFSIAKRDL